MVYNPTGSNNSSLISLVAGTISFVAGATAKHGDMKIDTPVATMGIRGTAVLVEIDFEIPCRAMAPPVAFQVLVEPDGTTGSYILLDKTDAAADRDGEPAGHANHRQRPGHRHFHPIGPIPADAQQLINEMFALKFTDANPKYIGIPPLTTRSRRRHSWSSWRTARRQPQFRYASPSSRVETPTGPPPSGGNTRFHLNIPPELVASGNHFTERF